MSFANIDIIIPAYQPSESVLTPLVPQLLALDFKHIVIINDGSNPAKKIIFDQLATMPRVTVIHHPKNMGKGAALKTGMRWLLANSPDTIGLITVDADGQHVPKDIIKVANEFQKYPNKFILGVRAFDTKVPLRSRFGNSLTRALFYWKYKTKIQDTQTGMRAVPRYLMQEFLQIPMERYEYEMACLIYAVKNKRPMEQIEVDTLYINHNISSHFNPIVDSIRVYRVFLKQNF